MSEISDVLHEQGETVYLSGQHGEAVKTIYLDGAYRPITPDMEAVCAYCDKMLQAERAEVRRLREERTRLLDEAAKRATAWWYSGDEFAKRGVDPELDRLADELRAAVRGEVK